MGVWGCDTPWPLFQSANVGTCQQILKVSTTPPPDFLLPPGLNTRDMSFQPVIHVYRKTVAEYEKMRRRGLENQKVHKTSVKHINKINGDLKTI